MKSKYVMTEKEVESLAADRTSSMVATEAFDGTYFKVLITGIQAKLGPKRGKRPETESQLEALDSVAVPFYAAVLRGVITPEIVLDASLDPMEVQKRTRERNRRATFARTAKSTIVTWIEEGGDIRGVDVTTVTKSELRAAVAAARADRADSVSTRVERAQRSILEAVAREGPDVARDHLEAVIAALQEALDDLPDVGGTTTTIHARRPVEREARVLNRGA